MAGMVLGHREFGLAAALAAGAALGVALGAEYWGHLVPCALCLWERWPYRIAIVLGIAVAFLPPLGVRMAQALLALTVLAGAALAAVHVGVELHWWPSPLPECMAPSLGSGSIAERLAHMPATPAKPCDDPTYLIPGVPLSIAAMNLVFASLFTAAAIWALLRKPQP